MVFIDPRDVDGIDLYKHLPFDSHLDTLELLGEKDPRTFKAGVAFALVIDMLVDLGTDLGIDCIEGDRDISDIIVLQDVNLVRKEETVGADTLDDIRVLLMEALQGLERLLVCEWVARPGNADDLDVVEFLHDFLDKVHGLIRVEYLGSNTGTTLIHAIIIPDTVIALDIAFGSNRNMAPAKTVTRLLGITGVLLDFAHLRRIPLDFLPVDFGDPYLISHGKHQ
jgi:hypothetical protein